MLHGCLFFLYLATAPLASMAVPGLVVDIGEPVAVEAREGGVPWASRAGQMKRARDAAHLCASGWRRSEKSTAGMAVVGRPTLCFVWAALQNAITARRRESSSPSCISNWTLHLSKRTCAVTSPRHASITRCRGMGMALGSVARPWAVPDLNHWVVSSVCWWMCLLWNLRH